MPLTVSTWLDYFKYLREIAIPSLQGVFYGASSYKGDFWLTFESGIKISDKRFHLSIN